ncbi:hypothetical protein [Asticcacaulis sp. 201]|uniref:hypothetical protein n=1 Tax=Asticcacaulis sp. 201 TaxID=3028787 RepID=UPI002916C5B4|nr:hypothetical protein [Asticcacaulis sp. 201]MDV6330301.1 hypothetical protein [Asticcacaulis sp. 201]
MTLKAPYARGDEVIIPVTRQGVATELHLRATDLSRVAETPAPPSLFATEIKGMDIPADMQLNQVELNAGGHHYLLAWATLPQNRDQPRDVVPSPMPLMLFEK